MNVPLHLKRRPEAAGIADAFLFRTADFAPLLSAIRLTPGARIFPVHGGFVLVPHSAVPTTLPGAIRLRRLGGDLFVPHDAILVPSLLPDEIAALTQDRGMVVLPDRSILAFDPDSPLPASRWLAAPVRRAVWELLPPAPELANELVSIEHPAPPEAVIEILAGGEPDDADPISTEGPPRESDRPASGSAFGRAAGSIGMAAGRLLAWLGRNLGMPGLARAGANLARRAVEAVPRLTERLFGEQEAALRNLLRELQEGDPEKALRRAPPAVGDPDAPSRIDAGSSLGSRDPRYSLRNLIGGNGVQGAWLGGGDVWAKLAEEYRRLAREAIARGDFRRAAYLHGMLLRDYRAAANALLAGGLHRDAAILLRDKVKDEAAAARAFDQAGDFDEALRLYDRCAMHEEAGDLLMRLHDQPRARERYLRAADARAARQEWHAAGDFVWRKLGDRAEACRYFREGWLADRGEMMPCGRRLFSEHVAANDSPKVRELFDEAVARFGPPRPSDARTFFHHVLSETSADLRDDFADRVRLLFADHLSTAKSQGRGEKLARDLFDAATVWPPAVARDAAFAAGSSKRKHAEAAVPPPKQIVPGLVRAVAYATESGSLVIATDEELTLWCAQRGRTKLCGLSGTAVLGVAVAPEARRIVLLRADRGGKVELSAFTEAGTIFQLQHHAFDESADGPWHLEPRPLSDITVATPSRREMFVGQLNMMAPVGYQKSGSNTHLLACDDSEHYWDWDDRFIRCLDGSGTVRLRWVPHWTPTVPPGSSLAVPPLDWTFPHPGCLEVAGVDAEGILHWSRFSLTADAANFNTDGEQHRFRAVCIVSAGSVIGATDDNTLLYVSRGMMVELSFTDDAFRSIPARIAALFATGRGKEILVVFEDGSIVPIRDWR